MTFNRNIPQGDPSPAAQVGQVQTNFSQYASIFANNHTSMTDPTKFHNQGDHEAIVFEKQLQDPGVTQDLVALYAKDAVSKLSTQPQLFFQIPVFLPTALDPTNAGNPAIQLTFNSVSLSAPVYQSFLPAGYLLFWGTITDITIPIVLNPDTRGIIVAIATPNNFLTGGPKLAPYDISTQILSTNSFKINSTLNQSGPVVPYTFIWMAIAQA